MKRLRDWLCTLPMLAFIGVVGVSSDPVVRIARRFGIPAMDRVIVAVERTMVRAFRICRVHVTVETAEGFDFGTPAILVSNHQSNFDIPLLGGLVGPPHPRFVALAQLSKRIPLVSFSLRHGGHALVNPRQPRQALQAIRDLGIRSQEDGTTMVIFPEGTRALDGDLGDFKAPGTTTLLAAAPDLPVVPVTIDGSWSLMKESLWPTPYGHRVRICFGSPMSRAVGDDPQEVIDGARDVIAVTIADWRHRGIVGDGAQ